MRFTAIVTIWPLDDDDRDFIEIAIRNALRKNLDNDFEIQYVEQGNVRDAFNAWERDNSVQR